MALQTRLRIHAQPPKKTVEKVVGKEAVAGIPTPEQKVAVLIVHGMGQQVPFETVSTLAQGILSDKKPVSSVGRMFRKFYGVPSNADPGDVPETNVRRVQLTPNGDPLSRVEFELPNDAGASRTVHVYEAYWAPLTEGQISFFETVGFLLGAGWDGLVACVRGRAFKRWMFGDFQNLHIKLGTFFALLLTLIGVLVFLAPAIFFGYVEAQTATAFKNLILHPVNMMSAGLHTSRPWSWVFLLAGLLFYAWWIRRILVQYVGDVAIYVSSNTVNRFYEVRHKIQQTALDVAKQIYAAEDPAAAGAGGTKHLYDRVVMVGHSLGSVIVYDTLNAAINWDLLEQPEKQHDVVARTPRLITFGSPLDKTAFLFRTQVSSARFLREAMAALQQPLILNYLQYRPMPGFGWVNIYSRADIVSGRLAYYDVGDANFPGFNPVYNVVDPKAWVPIYAHLQYWYNPTLHGELRKAIFQLSPF